MVENLRKNHEHAGLAVVNVVEQHRRDIADITQSLRHEAGSEIRRIIVHGILKKVGGGLPKEIPICDLEEGRLTLHTGTGVLFLLDIESDGWQGVSREVWLNKHAQILSKLEIELERSDSR